MPKTSTCVYCRTMFTRPPSAFLNGSGQYCSRSCAYRARRKPRESKPGFIQTSRGTWHRIDTQDSDLSNYAWAEDRHGYAFTDIRGKRVTLSRAIAERIVGRPISSDQLVDHINRDCSDNRRRNLRLANKSENGRNRGATTSNKSGYKGVCKRRQAGGIRWIAYVGIGYENRYVGIFDTPEEAAWMYDQWALALHGEFAVTNFDYR